MTAPAPDAADLAPAPAEGDRRWRLRHLPAPLAATAVTLVVATMVGWLVGGAVAAVGVAVGVAVVGLAQLSSTLVVAWADSVAPRLVMPVGIMAYVTKISVLGAIMMMAAALDWVGLIPMAWGIAAGVAAWTGAHIWWTARTHRPPRRSSSR
jgi:hypothetical protein